MGKDEAELETSLKVVAIMQAITEDLDKDGKRAWRKMLGIAAPSNNTMKERVAKTVEKMANE
jgi:hypothetical protein